MPTRLRPAGLAAAALVLLLPAAAGAATHTIDCRGSGTRCTATVPLAGTKTGDRVVVRLTDTDLALRSILPSSPSLTAKYGFGGFSTRLGGSEFVALLLRDGSVGRDANVRLTFDVPPDMRPCADATVDVGGGASVRLTGLAVHGLRCAAGRRLATECVSATGPGQGWTAFQVDRTVTLRRGARRVAFTAPAGGATCVPVG
jgi:hypothetical protein